MLRSINRHRPAPTPRLAIVALPAAGPPGFGGADLVVVVLAVEDGAISTPAGVAAAIDVCLEVVRRSVGPGPLAGHPARPAAERGLAEVRAWMRAHLDEHMTLDELANRAFMSRRQFTRTFRAETGGSPWQWLLTQRLAAARRLLEETGEPVEWIARRCGFATPVAFRTRFKQLAGVPPSRYRERMRDVPEPAALSA